MSTKLGYPALLAGVLTVFTGTAGAAVNCVIEPGFSVIAQGQTVDLKATCLTDADPAQPYALKKINWHLGTSTDNLNNTAIDPAANITLTNPINVINFTTPVSLGASTNIYFELWGAPDLNSSLTKLSATPAQVAVEAALGLDTDAASLSSMSTVVPGACGTAQGNSANSMPSGEAACSSGKQTLLITSPTAYSWTCASRSGGSDASCYAIKGFTVSASVNGGNGTVSGGGGVASGGYVAVTASPSTGFSTSFAGSCPGAQSGNSFNAGPVSQDCTVIASFANTPIDATCGSPGASLTAPSTNLCGLGGGLTGQVGSSSAATWNWTCAGSNGGRSASCSVARKYTVTATDGGSVNGDVSPASVEVQHGETTTISATNLADGYSATFSGCGASGSSGVTSAITEDCTVTATFAQAPSVGACGQMPANTNVSSNWTWLGQTRSTVNAYSTLSFQYTHDGRVPTGLFDWSGSAPLYSYWSTCPGVQNMSGNGCLLGKYASVDGTRRYRSANSTATDGCTLTEGVTYYFNLKAEVNGGFPAVSHRSR